jgi:hypothetical protein
MLVWAIISTILFLGSLFVIVNLLRKYEKLEDDSEKYEEMTERNNRELAERVVFIDNEITTIDKRGSFEADDEVGNFFKKIKELRDLLKEYIEK